MSSQTQIEITKDDSPNEILEKLQVALRKDGDFPVRAKVVTELRNLVNSPKTTIGQITEVILREPSLGTRVLSLVNSAFYQGAQPIMTITQAVNRLGMRALSDLCAGFVLMQRFVPAAKRGGVFTDSLKKSILMSLVSSYLVREVGETGVKERGYLAGTFYNLGHLLLAYYFPQVYEAAGKRANAKNIDVLQSIQEVLGVSPLQLSLSIVDALEIPDYYRAVLAESHKSFDERNPESEYFTLANALATAEEFSRAVVLNDNKDDFLSALEELSKVSGFSMEQFEGLVENIPFIFREHCELIELNFLQLPDYIVNFDEPEEVEAPPQIVEDVVDAQVQQSVSQFSRFTEEIREAIEDAEPLSSIITTVMETLAFGLKFDRVLLLMANDDQDELQGRMWLGARINVDPKSIRRPLRTPDLANAPDVAAFTQRTSKIFGDALFHDGWPFAAIPIGSSQNKPIGVIYADKISSPDDDIPPLDARMQASLSILVDLLDQAAGNSN
ncbi:MAG: HDOD domain-containing protein [Bdellovibrionales bacterium]|nr:HDOD domain-containing protein [Bdellovibrionales bacterium]